MGGNTNNDDWSENMEHTTFYDQADKNIEKKFQNIKPDKIKESDKLSPGVMSDAENEVLENEEASLQDESYSFDEDNTGSEEYHDAGGDYSGELDFDNDQDYIQ